MKKLIKSIKSDSYIQSSIGLMVVAIYFFGLAIWCNQWR